MIRDRLKAMEIACAIISLAWHSRDPEASRCCDGFCEKCPASRYPGGFRTAGDDLKYVEQAVREKLVRDGIEPHYQSLKELEWLWAEAKL
jgi:hypothetical protein